MPALRQHLHLFLEGQEGSNRGIPRFLALPLRCLFMSSHIQTNMWTSLHLRITLISRCSRIRSRTAINRDAHRSQQPPTVIITCGQVEETDELALGTMEEASRPTCQMQRSNQPASL